jgi:uncharacterized protein (DUF1684 family)
MNRFFLLLALCSFALVLTFSSCSDDDGNAVQEFNANDISKSREEKDYQFKNSDNSPLAIDRRSDFIGLQYFPITEEYFVFADFTPFETTDTISLPTTKAGDFRKMIRYGKLNFQIAESKSLELTAYKELDIQQDQLFVPFKDKTSGFTTYQAGRYLEISEPDEQQMCIIDFNRAYNPYCAYNAEYSCPLIPSENILPVFIKAGEKNPPSK